MHSELTDPRFAKFVTTYDSEESEFTAASSQSYDLNTGEIKEAS